MTVSDGGFNRSMQHTNQPAAALAILADRSAAFAAGRDPASLQGISLEAVIRTRLSLFSPLTGFR